MVEASRVFANLFRAWFQRRRVFPAATLEAIRQRVARDESTHRGEIVFAIESRLALADVFRGVTATRRAVQLFAGLGVWETECNSGVLIYVLLAEQRIEIFADRGVARRVSPERWKAVCEEAGEAYARGEFEAGSLAAIDRVSALLQEHFPAGAGQRNPNELDDDPVVL
jgi:uncharacterized membrane protein